MFFTSEAAHQVYTQKPHNYLPNALKLPLLLQKKKICKEHSHFNYLKAEDIFALKKKKTQCGYDRGHRTHCASKILILSFDSYTRDSLQTNLPQTEVLAHSNQRE